MSEPTPARLYAALFGGALTLTGLLGFFVESSFETGDQLLSDELIVFPVNGWHNVAHLLSGLAGLILAGSSLGSRLYAAGLGVAYVVLAAIGFTQGGEEILFEALPTNTEENILHLVIGLTGLLAYAATRSGYRADPPSQPAGSSTPSPGA